MLTVEEKEQGVEGARRPSHVTPSPGKLDLATVVEGGACDGASRPEVVAETRKHTVITTVDTAEVASESDVGGDARTVGAGQDAEGGRGSQEQREDAKGEAREESRSEPSAEVRVLRMGFWFETRGMGRILLRPI